MYHTQNFKGCKQLSKRALLQGRTDLRREGPIFPADHCFHLGYGWHFDSDLMRFKGQTEHVSGWQWISIQQGL